MMNAHTTSPPAFPRWVGLTAALLALFVVATGCDSEDLGDSNPGTPTVADYVAEVPAFSALNAAVQTTDLAGTLAGTGPFTVFAPTDGAFVPALDASLNEPVARRVIQRHVLPQVDSVAQIRAFAATGQTADPLVGAPLSFTIVDTDSTGADTLLVNTAQVTNGNAAAANGLVHVVDGLLIDAVDRATLTPRFTIFARLVKEAGLAGALRSAGPNDGRTIFAPTNAAFLDTLDTNENGSLESSELPGTAADLLQFHVLDGVILAAGVPTTETDVPTLQGTSLTVVRNEVEDAPDEVIVNPDDENATVLLPDVVVDNGVIHGIDTVLFP
jgi:uncharacterized surface protein with fasciclin (FAS1) repeats